ncbi:MAG: hypothetical protein ABI425_04965 [Patescibacteria group bacterium]
MSHSSDFFEQIASTYLDTQPEKTLFKAAVKKMRASLDPLHDERHIEAMLTLFHELDKQKKLKLKKAEKKIAVLAIAWHDVWISQRNTPWFMKIWFNQAIEGIASARLFRKNAKLVQLAEDQIEASAYAIRKHSNYQWFELNTAAAQILHDLDWLEFYSVKRVKKSVEILRKRGLHLFLEWSWFHLVFGNLYMKLRTHNEHLFYHYWAKDQFSKIQKEYFDYVHKLQKEAKKNSYFRLFLKHI